MNTITNCALVLTKYSKLYNPLKVIIYRVYNDSFPTYYIESEFTLLSLSLSPFFQNLKGLRTASCYISSQPILPAAPTIVSLDEDRRDASQKYYIGYRYVAQSDKNPREGSCWLDRFSSRWNRGLLLFSQPSISMTQPPDGHSHRGTRSSSLHRPLRSLIKDRNEENDTLRWSRPQGIPRVLKIILAQIDDLDAIGQWPRLLQDCNYLKLLLIIKKTISLAYALK